MNFEKNKLDLTSIASKIIKTQRKEKFLLDQTSIEDISMEFHSTPQKFTKVENLIKHIVTYAQKHEGEYSMGFLNFYPSYKKIVDLRKEIENRRTKGLSQEEYDVLEAEILKNEKNLEQFESGLNKTVLTFLQILNDDQPIILLQALNRKLGDLEFNKAFSKVDKS